MTQQSSAHCVCVCGGLFVFSSLIEHLQEYHLYTTHTHTHQMPTLLLQQTVNIYLFFYFFWYMSHLLFHSWHVIPTASVISSAS